ncbi:MAG: D-alanyl-D-alanine carboxypeptidase [Lachnospiraceae bacterium]|nr:D-alanyl-D-alanine carboxypeptidase [Lachnospiraceae bacterium]
MDYLDDEFDFEAEERRRQRRARIERRKIERRKRERRKRIIIRALFFGVPAILIIALVVVLATGISSKVKEKRALEAEAGSNEGVQEIVSLDNSGIDTGESVSGDSHGYATYAGQLAQVKPTNDGNRPHPLSAFIEYNYDKDHPYANTNPVVDGMIQVGEVKFKAGYEAVENGTPIYPLEDYATSLYSILVNEQTGEIVAARSAYDRMYPASMTKIMTLLVAVENIKNLDDVVYASQEAADYSYSHDGSAVNWSVGEKLTVTDLLYGTILSSGADAAYDLAVYVAGSHEAFVDMMNAKCEELGIADTTHFTNCPGFYDDNHYTTAYDMSMILKAAVENDLCREVLSAHTYNTPSTEEHPDGMLISNWFLRRIEDKDCRGFVMCAKTGFVNQSGNCAASYMISNSGTPYICVTGHAHSAWRAIYDHVGIYYNYTN